MNGSALSGLATSFFVHGFLLAAVVGYATFGGGHSDEPPKLKMVTIEASLAYKAKDAPKQPQKQRRAPPPEVKPEGVSRDADKKVEPDVPPKPEPEKVDFEKQFEKFKNQRQQDDNPDLEVGDEPPRPGGAFDGSEHGFADVSKGDPYMQELAGQVFEAWNLPTLEKGKGTAVGCVRIHAEGHVVDTKLWTPSQNSNIDLSVELALKALQKARKADAKPVPRHLSDVTTQWTCFKFTP